ncbi:MAG: cellulase family glycosylhydrolase [Chitinophagaceae bacterium]|nr:cellulase family glycosylhydrolase [Chitinophagaceae bacterium]
MKKYRVHLILLAFSAIVLISNAFSPINRFVVANGTHFEKLRKKLTVQGCNYWYGGYLALDEKHKGKQRLAEELDFLQQKGINNLRVFFCGEGNNSYPYRITPALQEKPGELSEEVLRSFDYFLNEVAKRNMTVVLVLNNNWEWSGGFGQYLEWTTKEKAPLPKTKSWDWDAYCTYISGYYANKECQQLFEQYLNKLVLRVNTVNKIAYKNDPNIFSWELANEPRPMNEKAIDAYRLWIAHFSSYIKKMDRNHMVTIGVEGMIGTNQDYELFKEVHAIPSIDYATIHLWPGIWQWYKNGPEHVLSDSCSTLISDYFKQHASLCKELGKPLVLEEFGLQRDGNSYSYKSNVEARNRFYESVYQEGKKNNFAGFNFWGFAGVPKKDTTTWFWKEGEPYSADPPQEQQGLFSVFESDESTWEIITRAMQEDE